MPFKTKLTPNYQMNWGHSFPKAVYPKREKKKVETFDIKAFVNKKREEKINNMLGKDSPAPDMFNKMSNPFAGFNEFENKQRFGRSESSGFNVDDIVKRIDAKIAELEEEERQENLKKQNTQSTFNKNSKNDNKLSRNDISISDTEPKYSNLDEITDDQFFDDFFSDE